jgi:hypothetical protein
MEGEIIVHRIINAALALLNPQLDEHRTVVRELIPHPLVSLAVGDLAEGRAINPGQNPPVDDDMVNELGERVVPAAHGHLLRQRGEIGVGGVAIVQVGPHSVSCSSDTYASKMPRIEDAYGRLK